MDGKIIVQGRGLSPDDIQAIRDLIAARPDDTRWKISRELCALWKWQTLTGQAKDMACRAMLNKLDERGLITLPPKARETGKSKQVFFEFPYQTPGSICGGLAGLTPLRITFVTARSPDARLVHQLLSSYHYLGFRTNVGETIGYLVRDRQDRVVACAVFGAAAWKTAPRDPLSAGTLTCGHGTSA